MTLGATALAEAPLAGDAVTAIKVNNCTHTQTVEQPSVTQTHNLEPLDAEHSHVVDEANFQHNVNDCIHDHTAEQPVFEDLVIGHDFDIHIIEYDAVTRINIGTPTVVRILASSPIRRIKTAGLNKRISISEPVVDRSEVSL